VALRLARALCYKAAMTRDLRNDTADRSPRSPRATGPAPWQPPQLEALAFDCESTAHAPDGDEPLS